MSQDPQRLVGDFGLYHKGGASQWKGFKEDNNLMCALKTLLAAVQRYARSK